MSANANAFRIMLAEQCRDLFANDPEYAYVAKRCTPDGLADKMTAALANGTASKDDKGIKRTCKALGIAYTYKAISAYLNAPDIAHVDALGATAAERIVP